MTKKHYCNFCDKTVNKKRKSKHDKTETHKVNGKKLFIKNHIEKPILINVSEKINNYINKFLNDFEDGNITCNFSLVFDNGLVNFITNTMAVGQYLVLQRCGCLIIFEELLTNIDEHIEKRYKFNNVSHLKMTTTKSRSAMTKSFYLEQKKSMLEWAFLKKEHKSVYKNGND